MKHATATALLLVCAAALRAQPEPSLTHRMEITLERLEDGQWVNVDPGLVFEQGDQLRFRFRANFDGFLYVMNQGTSGRYELLFPREETGADNRIERNKEHQIPSTDASFRIAGPPGHDIVYWLVTPVLLGETGGSSYQPLPPPPENPAPAERLRPRCDDSIFRARGVCVDSAAGPRNIGSDGEVPENLARVPRLRSRELIIMKKGNQASVSTPASQEGPVFYEYRIAHR